MLRKILVVTENIAGWEELLFTLCENFNVINKADGEDVLDILRANYKTLSAIILCAEIKSNYFSTFLSYVKTNPIAMQLPVIIIADAPNEDAELRVLSFGANDFIPYTANLQIIVKRISNFIYLREMSALSGSFHKEVATSERMNVIMENIASGISAMVFEDRKEKLLFSNEKFYEIVGSSQSLFSVISPRDRERVTDAMYSMALGSEITLEYRIERDKNTEIWVRHHLSAITLTGIEPIVLLGVIDDITAEKASEFAMILAQESIRRRSELLDYSSSAVSVRDAETRELLFVNDTCAKMCGKPIEQAFGTVCFVFLKNATEPCPYCCMKKASQDSFVECKYSDAASGRHYMTRGKFIQWDGKKAFVEYTTDETASIEQHLQLAASQRALEAASKNSGISFWHYDLDTQTVDWSEFDNTYFIRYSLAFNSVADYAAAHKYIHPADVASFIKMCSDMYADGETSECTARFLNAETGHYNCFHTVLTRLRDPYYTTRKVIAFAENVDLQMDIKNQYAKELEMRNELIKKSLEYFEIDVTDKYLIEYHSKLTGVPGVKSNISFTSEITAAILSYVYEPDREYVKTNAGIDVLAAAYEQGETSRELLYRRYAKEDELHWTRATVLLVKKPATMHITAFICMFDVDEEETDKLAISSLITEEVESLSIIYVKSGMARLIKVKNDISSIQDSVLFPHDEYIKKINFTLFSEEDREKCEKFLELKNLVRELKKDESVSIMYGIKEADGTFKYKRTTAYYLNETHSEIIIVRRDITSLYEEEQRQKSMLKATTLAALEANHAKGEFLSCMSHDMRTPMNAILGMTYLAKEEKSPEKIAEYLENITVSSQYLLSLINNVLDLSKIESGKAVLHEELFILNDFITGINTVIRPLMNIKNIEFTFKMGCSADAIIVDKLRFNQIFYNLLSNASKYTPNGGCVEFTAEHIADKDDKYGMRFCVRDNGIGMSEAFQKVLFTPFTQEYNPAQKEQQGSGLGLAIVKSLVELMGGTLSVKSKQGEGSEFTVDLYVTKAEKADIPKPTPALDFSVCKGVRVLAVEDNSMNILIIQTLLEHKGFIVTIAHDGAEAVKLFSESNTGYFTLILMDIRMPIMNGIEATKVIRALPRADATSVPIIAMTADVFNEKIEQTAECGMNDYLTKPINPDLLFSTMVKWIEEVSKIGYF